jgi:dTDP-4-dehydrorhamnose reductase
MRVLVTGASGQLGAHVLDALLVRGHSLIAWSGADQGTRLGIPLQSIDLTDLPTVERRLSRDQPDAIVHLAAISSAAGVWNDPEGSAAINIHSTSFLAQWCHERDRRFVFTSTDLVFRGDKSWNREDEPTDPVMAYGRSKRQAEETVHSSRALIARLPLMYGPSRSGRPGFLDQAVAAIRRGEPRLFFEDEFRTPLDFASAARILIQLLESELAGTFHVAGSERLSRFHMMARIIAALGLDASLVRANRQADAPGPEPRPADVSLDTAKLSASLAELHRPNIEDAAKSWT